MHDSPRERKVGLEAELARVGREHLSVLEAVAGDERAVEHRLDEELRVEVRRRRVERGASDALLGANEPLIIINTQIGSGRNTDRVDCVLRTDGVGYQEPHDLDGDEPGVAEASEDRVGRVRRERDQVRGRRLRVVGAPGEERQLGTTVAVPHADGPSELDARVIRDVNISTAWVTSPGGRGELTSHRTRRCA